jgi:hypothetical protein
MQGLFLFSAAHQLESVEHYEEVDLCRPLAFSVICHRQNSGLDLFLVKGGQAFSACPPDGKI